MSQDITWVRGQIEEWTIALTMPLGVPYSTIGLTAIEFEVKKYDGHVDPPVLTLTAGSGITPRAQTGGNVGVCDLVATTVQTFAIPAGTWRYDVFVTRADGERKRAVSGTLTVTEIVNFP